MTEPLGRLIEQAELALEALRCDRAQAEHDRGEIAQKFERLHDDEQVIKAALGVLRRERLTYHPGSRGRRDKEGIDESVG